MIHSALSSRRAGLRAGTCLAATLFLAACGAGLQPPQADAGQVEEDEALAASALVAVAGAPRAMAAAAPKAVTVQNPILFVTQVPLAGDPFGSRVSSFANHFPDIKAVPRGGDLMIRYPDGTLRNLTREAGYGMDGQQGANAIAVREPTVHWSGNKAVFSMVVGAPERQHGAEQPKWQLYEVTGLGRGETARITKVPRQPTGYNNISPVYASDDRILFTSTARATAGAHLYPQLDEYESTETVTGIFSRTRQAANCGAQPLAQRRLLAHDRQSWPGGVHPLGPPAARPAELFGLPPGDLCQRGQQRATPANNDELPRAARAFEPRTPTARSTASPTTCSRHGR